MKKKIIKSFERACEVTGDNPNQLPDVSWMPENRARSMTATYKLEIIEKAQNMLDKFVADYSNPRQAKWYPWLQWVPSRSCFVFSLTSYTGTATALGSRFCFKDGNTAREICETHIDLYNDMMLKS